MNTIGAPPQGGLINGILGFLPKFGGPYGDVSNQDKGEGYIRPPHRRKPVPETPATFYVDPYGHATPFKPDRTPGDRYEPPPTLHPWPEEPVEDPPKGWMPGPIIPNTGDIGVPWWYPKEVPKPPAASVQSSLSRRGRWRYKCSERPFWRFSAVRAGGTYKLNKRRC